MTIGHGHSKAAMQQLQGTSQDPQLKNCDTRGSSAHRSNPAFSHLLTRSKSVAAQIKAKRKQNLVKKEAQGISQDPQVKTGIYPDNGFPEGPN
jgi:hypothetical protein